MKLRWLVAWWQQMTGRHADSDPWQDDPRIRAERIDQHDRITRANRGTYYDQWSEHTRDAWRRQPDVH